MMGRYSRKEKRPNDAVRLRSLIHESGASEPDRPRIFRTRDGVMYIRDLNGAARRLPPELTKGVPR